MPAPPTILTLNAGSSSIKFALYRAGEPPVRGLHGSIERIGSGEARMAYVGAPAGGAGDQRHESDVGSLDHPRAAEFLLDWLEDRVGLAALAAVGHRIVHGGPRFYEPQRVGPAMLAELRRLSAFAPEHLPAALELIDRLGERAPGLAQVACFDTAFHRGMPQVARLLPIPRRYQAQGVERFGFHGLSYEYLMGELGRVAGRESAAGKVVLCHLGNGASLAAVKEGKCVDTSMAFTPAAGVPMSTRSGDLDPGLAWYLAQSEGMGAQQFDRMVNQESGLLGMSETSSDIRDLLAAESNDTRAAEAVAVFCYQVRKWIGAFAAALGGLDTLVFAGGIGENAPLIRARICADLGFLGVTLDAGRNEAGEAVISADGSRVVARVMRTDEDVIIARAVFRVLASPSPQSNPPANPSEA
ncbi:MAG: acetate/propionate family kinase [Betaproteobacteria bacterium]